MPIKCTTEASSERQCVCLQHSARETSIQDHRSIVFHCEPLLSFHPDYILSVAKPQRERSTRFSSIIYKTLAILACRMQDEKQNTAFHNLCSDNNRSIRAEVKFGSPQLTHVFVKTFVANRFWFIMTTNPNCDCNQALVQRESRSLKIWKLWA